MSRTDDHLTLQTHRLQHLYTAKIAQLYIQKDQSWLPLLQEPHGIRSIFKNGQQIHERKTLQITTDQFLSQCLVLDDDTINLHGFRVLTWPYTGLRRHRWPNDVYRDTRDPAVSVSDCCPDHRWCRQRRRIAAGYTGSHNRRRSWSAVLHNGRGSPQTESLPRVG